MTARLRIGAASSDLAIHLHQEGKAVGRTLALLSSMGLGVRRATVFPGADGCVDAILFGGYSKNPIASETVSHGSDAIKLSDGTTITLIGIDHKLFS